MLAPLIIGVRIMDEGTEILDFWFGRADDDTRIAAEKASLWWQKDAATDEDIRQRFEPQVRAAGQDKLDDWQASPEGRLALILLTDQFPRNIYRDTPEAFRFDGKARALCVDGLELGQAAHLRPIQRVFFYLPLEHSEDIDDQTWCVDLMRALAREVPEAWRSTFEGYVDYAEAHYRIIERFGRFPHRNRILGRESSDEERAFLTEPGSSF